MTRLVPRVADATVERSAGLGDSSPLPRVVKVLLAEDHQINQAVAIGMLEQFGCSVTLAADGRQAVETYSGGAFDVVLMDCQMPEMDGFEATRAIRAHELSLGWDPVPIIALTANALSGDRQKCLAAGMTDFVSKPYQSGVLRSAIIRWGLAIDRHRMEPDETEPPPQAQVLDRQALEQVLSINGAQGSALLAKLIRIFIDQTPSDVRELTDRLEVGDIESATRVAHTLKSTSATLGATMLAAALGDLEVALRAGADARSTLALVGEIEDRHAIALQALTRELELVHSS